MYLGQGSRNNSRKMSQLSDLVLNIRTSIVCMQQYLDANAEDRQQDPESFDLDMATFMRHCLLMYNMIEDGAVHYTSREHELLISSAMGDVHLLRAAILNNAGSEQLQLLFDNAELLERTFQTMLQVFSPFPLSIHL